MLARAGAGSLPGMLPHHAGAPWGASPNARSRWCWHQRAPAGVVIDGASVAWAEQSKSPSPSAVHGRAWTAGCVCSDGRVNGAVQGPGA